MQKDLTKFLQISVIGAAVVCGALSSPASSGEKTQENAKQHIYLSQMAKYPALSKEFKQEIETNAHPRLAPSKNENLFFWQLEDYKMLNAGFADVYAQNVAPHEVPATPEEVYLWQLEPYKELDKEFHDALQPQL